MAKTSLVVCLMLLVALGAVYGQQEEKLFDRFLKNFPKTGKDVELYTHKFMLDFVNEMETMCLATSEFKNLFAKLRDYIDFCFISASPRSKDFALELSRKAEQLTMAMSAASGTKDQTSMSYWGMILGLVSLEKHIVEMKKNNSKDLNLDLTIDHKYSQYLFVKYWVNRILRFVKEASEMKAKSFDTRNFGILFRDTDIDVYKRGVNDLKRPFSLPLYLKNLPKRREDVELFAYTGLIDFLNDLKDKCLASVEFRMFFKNLKAYMLCFKSVLPDTSTKPTEKDMLYKSKILFISMTALNDTKGGTLDSWKLVDGLYSMGRVLVEMKRSGSEEITFEELREITWSIMKWAQEINLFVKTASEKKGVSIDLSSFDKYSHLLVPPKGAR